MVLGLLLMTVDQHLARANALKNMILGVADVVAAIGFALFGPVHWTAAAPLAVGLLAGSMSVHLSPGGYLETCSESSLRWQGSGWLSACGYRPARADGATRLDSWHRELSKTRSVVSLLFLL